MSRSGRISSNANSLKWTNLLECQCLEVDEYHQMLMSRGRQISSKANVSRLNNSLKIYVHTRMHDRIHTFTHTCARSYICIHTCIHAYISIHTYIHTFMHTYAFINAYIHIFIYACIGPSIYTYTHMRTNKNADANDEIGP
jgi:hypothetical protein